MLEPHNIRWSEEFADLQKIYTEALGPLTLRVEHVGSTSVPDLLAKPILDIDIVISGYENFPQLVAILERLGYSYNGDQGIPEREAFKSKDEFTPHISPPRKWMTHHLYVCPEYSRELQRHLSFRNGLRGSAQLRRDYEKLKISFASRSGGDRKMYARIKEEECKRFVEGIVKQGLGSPCVTGKKYEH
jgi:GrpB-like predicted nucleotidyltransferase (UPF0157 family)